MKTPRLPARNARLWWAAALVLICFGGAGFAVAADRPHDPIQRPELTWRADQAAAPLVEALTVELEQIDLVVTQLSGAGRDVLGRLQGLDPAGTNEALALGDQASEATDVASERLLAARAGLSAAIETWRVGAQTRDRLARFDLAASSAQQVSVHWQELAGHARLVVGLLDDLQRHEVLAFEATAAGRDEDWDEALDLLTQAGAALAEARAARDQLPTDVVATLNDLLARYEAYDESLVALYAFVRDTGGQSGSEFQALLDRVAEAQAALPPDTGVVSVIVGEIAGRPLTDALVAIDQAHGDIIDALAEAPEESPEVPLDESLEVPLDEPLEETPVAP